MSIQTEISPFKLCSVKKQVNLIHQGQFQYKHDLTKGHTPQKKKTHLVDPEDHSILKVKGELFGGTECGEPLHAWHDLFNADHLHSVGHHQSVNHGDVRTLCHKTEDKEVSHYCTFMQHKNKKTNYILINILLLSKNKKSFHFKFHDSMKYICKCSTIRDIHFIFFTSSKAL